jgi:hypothetical protein
MEKFCSYGNQSCQNHYSKILVESTPEQRKMSYIHACKGLVCKGDNSEVKKVEIKNLHDMLDYEGVVEKPRCCPRDSLAIEV